MGPDVVGGQPDCLAQPASLMTRTSDVEVAVAVDASNNPAVPVLHPRPVAAAVAAPEQLVAAAHREHAPAGMQHGRHHRRRQAGAPHTRRTPLAVAEVEERQLLKTLRWYDGFVIALANPGFLLASLGYSVGDLGGWGAALLAGRVLRVRRPRQLGGRRGEEVREDVAAITSRPMSTCPSALPVSNISISQCCAVASSTSSSGTM